jgi:hypothetical protein
MPSFILHSPPVSCARHHTFSLISTLPLKQNRCSLGILAFEGGVGDGPSLGRYSLALRTSCDHIRTLPALSGAVPIVPSIFRMTLSLASHPEPIGPLFPRSGPSCNTQEHLRNLSHHICSLSSQRSASHVIVPSLLVRISLSLVIT